MNNRRPFPAFYFDWKDSGTFEGAKIGLADAIAYVNDTLSTDDFSPTEISAYSNLCFQLGTYHNHIVKEPKLALEFYKKVDEYEVSKEWLDIHLGLSYQQLMIDCPIINSVQDVDNLLTYSNLFIMAMSYIEASLEMTKNSLNGILSHHEFTIAQCDTIRQVAFTLMTRAEIYRDINKKLSQTIINQLSAHPTLGNFLSQVSSDEVIKDLRLAVAFHEHINLYDDQYGRAKCRLALSLFDADQSIEALQQFHETDQFWRSHLHTSPLHAGRFFWIYGNCLVAMSTDASALESACEKYSMALQLLQNTPLAVQIEAQLRNVALEATYSQIRALLVHLPFNARSVYIRDLLGLLAFSQTPRNGMTTPQNISTNSTTVNQIHQLVNHAHPLTNPITARYIYQEPRSTNSAGMVPIYRDPKGELYLGLVCEKNTPFVLNWASVNARSVPPNCHLQTANGTRLPERHSISSIQQSTFRALKELLNHSGGDWAKAELTTFELLEKLHAKGHDTSHYDINSEHTALRACSEQLGLNLQHYPNRKMQIISSTNSISVSAPQLSEQASNHHHQYLIYLGQLEYQPTLKPANDLESANWVRVSDIKRVNPTYYEVDKKILCVSIISGLETGLRQLWEYLLQECSGQQSTITGNKFQTFGSISHFVGVIENYYTENQLPIDQNLKLMLQSLGNSMPDKSYMGFKAHKILTSMLTIANCWMSDFPNHLITDELVNDLTNSTKGGDPRLFSSNTVKPTNVTMPHTLQNKM